MKFGKYFCGNEISEYGLKNGYVDYRTLFKSFDAVLNNDLMHTLENAGFYFEIVQGMPDYSEEIEELEEKIEALEESLERLEEELESEEELEEAAAGIEEKIEELKEQVEELEEEQDNFPDIYQYYIIDDNGYNILQDYTNIPLFYCSELDIAIVGITHYGTSWDYVLTDIECDIVK